MKIDYSVYKHRLIEYLQLKGVECSNHQNIRCFIPSHYDITGKHDNDYSCTINEDYVFCHACKQHGDIFDAVEWLDGITNKKEQHNHLAGIFGGIIAINQIKQKEYKSTPRQSFTPDPEALEKVRNYISNNPAIEEAVRTFFAQREKIKGGKYPEEVVNNLLHSFLYWPGLDIARNDLSNDTMRAAGIPYAPNPNTGNYTWGHAGLVIPLSTGFKLHFCTSKECVKYNSKGGKAFPVPGNLDTSKPIILVEGELDALVSRAAGINNVYSTGSVSGLTEEKIKSHLLSAKEIIFLFDNDDAGKSATGAKKTFSKNGKQTTTVPDKLLKHGFSGIIKIAVLEEYKDADECIRNNRADLIQKALNNAYEYIQPVTPVKNIKTKQTKKTPPEQSTKTAPADEPQQGTMSHKELKSVLKQENLQLSRLEKKDVEPFISACLRAVTNIDLAKLALQNWGATEKMLNNPLNIRPSYLVSIAEKYGLTYYFIEKIRRATLTQDELKQLEASPDTPLVPIDFVKVKTCKDFNNFIKKRGNKTAANLCAFVLGNRLAYTEETNCFYRFNGHVWEREPDPWGVVYNLLATIINYFIHNNKDEEYRNDDLYNALVAIERRSFRADVVKDLSVLPTIWHEKIQFDGIAIKETLTLLDGVIDFSGRKNKKIIYRTSAPEEFRMKMLPYNIDDVRSAKTPEKFLQFMKGNFANNDTLEMLNQFISLIPSRCAKYKVAGIFVGKSHTGKTTTINLLQDIYRYHHGENSATQGAKENMLIPLPAEKIMLRGRFGHTANGPDPFIAQLIGAGCAVCDETDKNDKIDSAIFKSFTGGGMLTVRNLHEKPKNYEPTAQLIISTNYSPKFDSSDQAVINRMVVVPFSIVHEPNSKDTKTEDYFTSQIRPEYPAIVKYYAEKYLQVKFDQNGKIKISGEGEKYKGDYVQNQATDLSRFVDTCIEFVKDETKFVRLKDVYSAFMLFSGAELDENGKPKDKESWTQSKFTRYFKGDYNEVIITQKKYPGHSVPEQIVLNCVLKDVPVDQIAQNQPVFEEIPELPKEKRHYNRRQSEEYEENPFSNDDDENNDIDIY